MAITSTPDTTTFERITPYDAVLSFTGLDPATAQQDRRLTEVETGEIERAIDDIYIAAAAGNVCAKSLIENAGRMQVRQAGEAAQAIESLDVSLAVLRIMREFDSQPHAPIADPVEALAYLDNTEV